MKRQGRLEAAWLSASYSEGSGGFMQPSMQVVGSGSEPAQAIERHTGGGLYILWLLSWHGVLFM